jgi:hypothetical protein
MKSRSFAPALISSTDGVETSITCIHTSTVLRRVKAGRRESLNQANKLSPSFAILLEALNRHRGKGQQKVTVERRI